MEYRCVTRFFLNVISVPDRQASKSMVTCKLDEAAQNLQEAAASRSATLQLELKARCDVIDRHV